LSNRLDELFGVVESAAAPWNDGDNADFELKDEGIVQAFKEMKDAIESELSKMEDKISDLKAMVKDKDEIIALLKSREGR
jgi:hypothetical protein